MGFQRWKDYLRRDMEKPKLINAVYLCGPLEGRTEQSKFGWRDYSADFLDGYGIASYIPGEDTTKCDERTICALDYLMIDNSECLLVNLACLGEDKPTNTGTLIEIGYARAKGKMVVCFSDKPWQRENRFLRGSVTALFFKDGEGIESNAGVNQESAQTMYVEDPLQSAIDYIAGYNARVRTKEMI